MAGGGVQTCHRRRAAVAVARGAASPHVAGKTGGERKAWGPTELNFDDSLATGLTKAGKLEMALFIDKLASKL